MDLARTGGLVAYQSDRIEELVDRLVLELAHTEKTTVDSPVGRPFVDHCVVLPTHNLETYLTYEIAARRGVAAGIDFITIEKFLQGLLPEADDEDGVEILDQMSMTRLVLSLLDDPAVLDKPELAPVRRFVVPETDPRDESVQRRKFQLAFRVARLFEEYGYSRRKLLDHWREGDSGIEAEYSESATEAHRGIEIWQMAIWRRLFGPDGRARNGETTRMTLPEAIFEYTRRDDLQLNWPTSAHIFGHSYLPRFFRHLFSTRTMAENHRLSLYVMTPSREYWSHGVAGDRDEDPVFDILTEESILSGDEYPLALSIWGRAGRDYQRMIDDVAYDRVDVGPDQPRPTHTLLQHLQRQIRRMETAADAFVDDELPADTKSINFWSCASVQRECEAIASEIYEIVTTHDDIRFNDIAVVVQPSERTLYQTHLQAAFDQTGAIPSNVIDVEGAEASPFLEAAEMLLGLPLGEFRRNQLLALLVHPNVVANHPEADAETWIQWCDDVNIFQGGDREDLDETYLDEDRFTWSQGLRRLVLGTFMSQPDDQNPEIFELGGDQYLPHETGHDDIDTVAVLAMVADELIGDARRARDQTRPLGEWLEYFTDQITDHLQPRDRAGRRTRMRYLGRLGRLAESDVCPDEEVGYQTAFEFAMAAMAEIEESHGQYLADGVVVSAFRPMRPIPFEVVFVTGLAEGQFPAPDPPDMLDLRRVRSEPHDVNPRYRDQYMFLETVISTRSRLYLSWVGRHAVTGDPIEPASAVHQMREMLMAMVPNQGDRAREVRDYLVDRVEFVDHPLRRWDDCYFPELVDGETSAETIDARGPDAIPPAPPEDRDSGEPVEERIWPNHHREARREARTRALRRRLDDRLPVGWRPTIHQLSDALDDEAFDDLADLLQWRRPDAERSRIEADSVVLQIRHLRRFLQCPLQGSAQVVVGIYDEDDDDAIDAEHEPFEAEFLTRLRLVRQAFQRALAGGDISSRQLEKSWDDHARTARLAGDLPAGVFFEAERDKSLGMLRDYASALDDQPAGLRLKRIRFGGARRREEVDDVRDPLVVDVELNDRSVAVELHGTVDVLQVDDGPLSALVVAAGKRAKAKHVVQAGLAQITLRAAGLEVGDDILVVTRGGDATEYPVDVDSPTEARDYLADLARQLLSGVHDYFLPVEFVQDLLGDDIGDIHRAADRKKEAPYHRDRPDVSSIYGPVRRWQDADPPDRPEADEMIRRRFAPFVEALS